MELTTIEQLKDIIRVEGSIRNAAKRLARPESTLRKWLNEKRIPPNPISRRQKLNKIIQIEGVTDVEFPTLPDPHTPDNELVDLMIQRFERRRKHHDAQQWMPINIKTDRPIGICWFGDPHVDNNGCNWPLLKRHADICAATDGMFGASIGDHTDNWVGRLTRLYAKSDQSRSTALQLAEIFISKMGIRWLLLLRGNHDMWSPGKDDPLMWMQTGGAPMVDWQAKVRFVFSNGREARVWAAHDFKGHSMWNSLHAAQKAAHMKEACDLYVCGHTHNWALHQEESASKRFTYWLARCRGYKFMDEYAELLGYGSQNEGAAIVSVINPKATSSAGFIQCFADVETGADYLTWLRKK